MNTPHTVGVVYSSTTVHAEAGPYQIALIEFPDGSRRLVRMEGAAVQIGDAVERIADRDVFHRKD